MPVRVSSQKSHTFAPNLRPSPERVEYFEGLIEISQSQQEALLARVNNLGARLAQLLHEHSAIEADHKSISLRFKALES